MKRVLIIGILLGNAWSGLAQTFVDLSPLFDTDAVLEAGGTGIGEALDAEGRRIDAATLPPAYTDGSVVTTANGRASFKFAPLKQNGTDAVAIDGQVLDVSDGQYQSLDLALICAPGALAYPFGEIEFRYTDGSKETNRLGPVAGWFNSPTAFDHTLHRFTDASGVQTIASFRTDFGGDEANFLVEERGNGNSGGNRFVDGTGYVLYRVGELASLTQATLGVTVGNNFIVSLAAVINEPSSSTDGYTEVANSMVLHDGFEHRALGNLKQYNIDLAPFLAEGTGEIYILLTDATPSNGWGPYIQQIQVYTGTAKSFEGLLAPVIDASRATVHASFQTGTTAETPYLFDNRGSGPSNRGHRFADGAGSITYRFDLPDDATQSKLTIDMANNFVVSLAGPSDGVRYFNMAAVSPEEKTFLIEDNGSNAGGDFRFADGTASMTYQFDLPDDVTTAFAKIHVGNQFVIEAAGPEGDFTVQKDWVAETGDEVRDNSNLDFYDVDLTPFLANNPSKVVRLRLSDGVPSDGWGPFLRSIVIQDRKESGEANFTTVLDSQSLFGDDVHDEYNKKYYSVDLASVLANNPKKEFFVRFTDGSTSDGWGPGIFWMAVYSGDLDIQADGLVFDNLKTTLGDPNNFGAGLLHRRYSVNSAKTLSAIALPAQPASEASQVYLLAATLNSGATVAPALQVTQTPENKVRLSWPASATGYQLKGAASITASASWAPIPEAPVLVGDHLTVDVAPTEPTRFFRLEAAVAP